MQRFLLSIRSQPQRSDGHGPHRMGGLPSDGWYGQFLNHRSLALSVGNLLFPTAQAQCLFKQAKCPCSRRIARASHLIPVLCSGMSKHSLFPEQSTGNRKKYLQWHLLNVSNPPSPLWKGELLCFFLVLILSTIFLSPSKHTSSFSYPGNIFLLLKEA